MFDSSVILLANTQYWAVMGDSAPAPGGGYNIPSNYSGGQYYQPSSFGDPGTSYDTGATIDAAFRLSGEIVPEPSSFLLVVLGVAGFAARRNRPAAAQATGQF